jgi:hypothetical protein
MPKRNPESGPEVRHSPWSVANECGACQHPQRQQIDDFLANGYLIAVAQATFDLPMGTLAYHRDHHLQGMVSRVHSDPIRLIRIAQDMTEAARTVVHLAQGEGNNNKLMLGIRQVLACVRLEGELTGAFEDRDPRKLLPFWKQLQAAILMALEEFPDARERVQLAIEHLSDNEGKKATH